MSRTPAVGFSRVADSKRILISHGSGTSSKAKGVVEEEEDENNIENRVIVSRQSFRSPIPAIAYNINNDSVVSQNDTPIPRVFRGNGNISIKGSADGLLFIQGNLSGLEYVPAVFNPSTGKCRLVRFVPPPAPSPFLVTWFGSLGNDKYAFLLVDITPNLNICHDIAYYEYTRGCDDLDLICRTPISSINYSIRCTQNDGIGILAQGVVYWPIEIPLEDGSFPCKILGYRLDSKEHLVIETPPGVKPFTMSLALFKDGCSLFASNSFGSDTIVDFWILKEEAWTKYARIDIGIAGSVCPLVFSPHGNGDLIMELNMQQLVKYSFNSNKLTILAPFDSVSIADVVIMCAHTLLSP